jgi:hypothetical protein
MRSIGRRCVWGVLTLLWSGLVVGSFYLWSAYEQQPGEIPDGYGAAEAVRGQWHLWMFVHPHCSCSRASLQELRRLLEQLPRQPTEVPVQATVYLVCPPEVPAGWEEGELLTRLHRWNDVTVVIDRDGRKAQRWNVSTSGHVIVLDPNGRVRFRGGITPGRGQQGDNRGSRRIVQILRGALLPPSPGDDTWSGEREDGTGVGPMLSTPVFGCPLGIPSAGPRAEESSWSADRSRGGAGGGRAEGDRAATSEGR